MRRGSAIGWVRLDDRLVSLRTLRLQQSTPYTCAPAIHGGLVDAYMGFHPDQNFVGHISGKPVEKSSVPCVGEGIKLNLIETLIPATALPGSPHRAPTLWYTEYWPESDVKNLAHLIMNSTVEATPAAIINLGHQFFLNINYLQTDIIRSSSECFIINPPHWKSLAKKPISINPFLFPHSRLSLQSFLKTANSKKALYKSKHYYIKKWNTPLRREYARRANWSNGKMLNRCPPDSPEILCLCWTRNSQSARSENR